MQTDPPASPDGDRSSWSRLHLWQIQPLRDIAAVVAVLGLIWLGSVISIVTVPLLLALLLAYLVEPVVRVITRHTRLGRRGVVLLLLIVLSVGTVLPVAGGLAYGVTETVQFSREVRRDVAALRESLADPESERLARRVPGGLWTGVRNLVLWARERDAEAAAEPDAVDAEPGASGEDVGGSDEADFEGVAEAALDLIDSESTPEETASSDASEPAAGVAAGVAAGDAAGDAAGRDESTGASAADAALKWVEDNAGAIARSLFRTGGDALTALMGLIGTLASLGLMVFLTAFFFFFMSTGWEKVTTFGREMVPERRRDRAVELATKLDRVVSGFVRGRLTIAVILGVFFAVGWGAVGVPLWPVLGLATGVLAAFPYAALVGLPAAIVLLALENHDGFRGAWWWIVFAPAVVYQAGQLADDYFLTPSIQGKETDLDIPTIMFALFAGGALFGVYGLLIAIPLMACIKVLVREILWPRYRAWVRGERDDALPVDRG